MTATCSSTCSPSGGPSAPGRRFFVPGSSSCSSAFVVRCCSAKKVCVSFVASCCTSQYHFKKLETYTRGCCCCCCCCYTEGAQAGILTNCLLVRECGVLRRGREGELREGKARGVAGGLACGACMKIGSIGGGGAGWRRRTPKSGREVGIVRDATTRQSGGVAWRARRRRTACNGAAEAENSSDPSSIPP